MEIPVVGLCFAAVVFLITFVLGVFVLLGKCDGLIYRLSKKNGEQVDVNRNRRVLGLTFISDSILVPLVIAFLFGLI